MSVGRLKDGFKDFPKFVILNKIKFDILILPIIFGKGWLSAAEWEKNVSSVY